MQGWLRRGAGAIWWAQLDILKKYLAIARRLVSCVQQPHLHMAADSSRVGGVDTEFMCVWCGNLLIGCWASPQDRCQLISLGASYDASLGVIWRLFGRHMTQLFASYDGPFVYKFWKSRHHTTPFLGVI